MNITDALNPRRTIVRRYMNDFLKERYPKHDELVSRLTHFMSSDKDVHDFAALAVDLYEMGYLKCMNDYKQKLNAMGMEVTLVPQKQN